jgi:hypothetical protein
LQGFEYIRKIEKYNSNAAGPNLQRPVCAQDQGSLFARPVG